MAARHSSGASGAVVGSSRRALCSWPEQHSLARLQTQRDIALAAWPGAQPIAVLEHRWGQPAADLGPPYDVVVACGARLPHTLACG